MRILAEHARRDSDKVSSTSFDKCEWHVIINHRACVLAPARSAPPTRSGSAGRQRSSDHWGAHALRLSARCWRLRNRRERVVSRSARVVPQCSLEAVAQHLGARSAGWLIITCHSHLSKDYITGKSYWSTTTHKQAIDFESGYFNLSREQQHKT